MKYPRVGRRRRETGSEAGVYADLDELVRLQFKARGFSFLPRQPIHSLLAGRHASRLRGRGLNFEELRRYLPGDDVRTIDWRVTARTRKTHVRVYTEERDRPVLLVVDQRLGMFLGSRRAMKSVVAAEAAAIAAWRVLGAGDRVGALVFDDTDVVEIRPHRSHERVMRILQAVVEKNHALRVDASREPNPAMLREVLERALRLAGHDYLVCLISDMHGFDAGTEACLMRLSEHNDALVAFVHDPLEVEMPAAGRLVVASGELQLEVNTDQANLRRKFSSDFEGRFERIRAVARKGAIPVIPLGTAEEVPEQLRRVLGPAGR